MVVPVYNSEKTLAELTQRIIKVFDELKVSVEIIFVNDCSRDGSWRKLKDLKANYGELLKCIDLVHNIGQHKAILCGFRFARGRYIITLDDDLQILPEEILKLIGMRDELDADLVYGVFLKKRHSWLRNLGSRVIEKTFKLFASTPGKGSSFKLISRSVVQAIKQHDHQYVYIDELLAWHASQTHFVTVDHNPREEGNSGYSLGRLLVMSFQIILNYTSLPLKIITWFGLLSSMLFLCVGLHFIYLKFTVGAQLGFTALIVAIFFSTGLILFSLGIIGEYIHRIFIVQRKKPVFSCREII